MNLLLRIPQIYLSYKVNGQEHLAGSICIAHISWSQGHEFNPHVGVEPTEKQKQNKWNKIKNINGMTWGQSPRLFIIPSSLSELCISAYAGVEFPVVSTLPSIALALAFIESSKFLAYFFFFPSCPFSSLSWIQLSPWTSTNTV